MSPQTCGQPRPALAWMQEQWTTIMPPCRAGRLAPSSSLAAQAGALPALDRFVQEPELRSEFARVGAFRHGACPKPPELTLEERGSLHHDMLEGSIKIAVVE